MTKIYQRSESISKPGYGWQNFISKTLRNSVQAAKEGNKAAVNSIIIRIGQVRCSLTASSMITDDVKSAIKEATQYLQAIGKQVNLRSTNEAEWIV